MKFANSRNSQSNTCDPSNIDQYVVIRSRSSSYKKYTDQALKKNMIQITISHIVNVRAMSEILMKVLSTRKHIDSTHDK